MDLDTERFEEPAEPLRRKRVEINSQLRKVFEQAGILLRLRRRRCQELVELRLHAGEFRAQPFHLFLDPSEKVTIGVTGPPQGDCEVCHLSVELGQLLPQGRFRFEMFITHEVACGRQAGLC